MLSTVVLLNILNLNNPKLLIVTVYFIYLYIFILIIIIYVCTRYLVEEMEKRDSFKLVCKVQCCSVYKPEVV